MLNIHHWTRFSKHEHDLTLQGILYPPPKKSIFRDQIQNADVSDLLEFLQQYFFVMDLRHLK